MGTTHNACILFRPLALAMLLSAPAASLPAQTAQWRPFFSSTDGFRAQFPSEPEVSKSNVPVAGKNLELRSYVAEVGATALYIGVCDYGARGLAADPGEMLSNAEKGSIEHMNAHLLSEQKIDLDGNRGLAFEADSDKLHFSARMYMVGGVLYQSMVATALDAKFAESAQFLDSFQLMPRPAAVAAPGPAADWKRYRYPDDGFSSEFPSQPEMQKQNVSTDAGTFELRTYATQDPSVTLVAAVCAYGASAAGKDPDALLAAAEKGAINNIKGHLTSDRKITLGAYHGVVFEANSSGEHVSARIYLVGETLYQMIVASPLNAAYAGSSRFLDSFQLLDGAGK